MKSIAIVGGGLSGLATAWFLNKELPTVQITIFESSDRLGGKIKSCREQDFLYEYGPNGFMDSRQEMVDLCNDLELQQEMVQSDDSAAKRFIVKNGVLKSLPQKPPQIFTSGFLPLSAKLRLLSEPFRKRSKKEDESLYDFCHRRLGHYVAEYLVDPFTSGVFGADCRQLSTRSAFKALWDMEQQEGSLFKGLRKKMRANKGQKPGKLRSFKQGMETLINALASKLKGKVSVELNSKVIGLSAKQNKHSLSVETTGEVRQVDFDLLVMASPAGATGTLLSSLDESLGQEISSIPYSAITVVAQGYHQPRPELVNAFGYLVPSAEKNMIMGSLFDAAVFPGRAPAPSYIIRTMVGGGKNPELIHLPDAEIYRLVAEENRQTLGLHYEADFKKIIRWQEAIPVYGMGHWKLLARIEQFTSGKSIFITGNAFYGVSMNDCVTAAMRVTKNVKHYMQES